jgi:hypothetical protein
MDAAVIALLVLICIIALAIVVLAVVAIGFSASCSSTDGVGYILKIVFNRPIISNLEKNKILYDMLDLTMRYMKNTKVWAMDGTLLGFTREERIICYDYDLDFEIMEEDWHEVKNALDLLVKENKEYGYIWYSFPTRKFAQLYHRKTMTMADFQVARIKGNRLDHKYNLSDILPLKRRKVKNMYNEKEYKMWIPNNAHNVLTTAYGKDYMTPDHICDKDCENCVKRD